MREEIAAKIETILFAEYNELFEITGTFPVHLYNAKIIKAKCFLWGCIKKIDNVIRYLRRMDIDVGGIIDCDVMKQGDEIEGVRVISIDSFLDCCRKEGGKQPVYVFILTQSYSYDSKYFIDIIRRGNCLRRHYACTEEDLRRITGIAHWRQEGRREYYIRNVIELKKTAEMFADENSREVFYAFLASVMGDEVYHGEEASSNEKYFFGKNKEYIYKHLKGEEVWINCGAAQGDTIFAYYSQGLSPNKIYAYEGDETVYKKLEENILLLPDELKQKVVIKNELINSKTDFGFENGEKCTLINADIEGAELQFLYAIEKIIKRDRPVCAIAVYHLKEDLVDIPKYLKQLDNYCFFLRKYTPWIGAVTRWSELVLYAVPIERR